MRKNILLILLSLFIFSCAYAQSSFTIQKIDIQGLHGISRSTVLNYMPVTVGSRLDATTSTRIIRTLYATGFFENIRLARTGNTLIIKVVQRPVISRIRISGNKKISTDKLKKALTNLNFSEGQVYNPSVLHQIKIALAHQYFMIGYYNARVNVSVTRSKENLVTVNIQISEGKPAIIRQIKIIGNYSFPQKTLLKQFKLTTPGLFTFYTHSDQYSADQLSQDLRSLTAYYLNHGFLKFRLNSSQVSISPDRKQVYIAIHVTEGSQYKLSGFTFTGRTILSKQALTKLVLLKPGAIFSRQDLIATNKAIADALGKQGYAHANVQALPKVNEKKKTVFLKIHIQSGPRIYVRRITLSGNDRTNDEVFRRSLHQKEGALISTTAIDKSKRNLLMLPFVRDVRATTKPVRGKSDEVDLNYKITEQSPAELKLGIGYSVLDRFIVNAAIHHRNVLGTGNSLGLDLSYSATTTSLNFSFFQPYYTQSGIGRSINVYTTHYDSSKANISDFATNEYGASLGYSYPVTENNYLSFGLGYSNIYLSVGSNPSTQLKDFVNRHRRHFHQIELNGGWAYQGFDRAIFPTKGVTSSISGMVSTPVSQRSLEYYKVSFNTKFYQPIYHNFLGTGRVNIGYGDGYGKYKNLPFFENYYAGGVGSVRGYEGNTLGPKDSNKDPLGGDFKVDGSLGIVFPNPISRNLRTTWFVDAGNAYDHLALNLRTSTGIEFDWLSPIGMLNFSLAMPLNKHRGDNQEVFQFNIGTSV